MVYYDLLVTVKADNITTVSLKNPEYQWCLEVQCNCGEVYEALFTEQDVAESENTKSVGFNYSRKCKQCKYALSITFYEKSKKSIACNKPKQALCSFEFRNCTPIKWNPTPGFVLESEAESTFDEVELSPEWSDYDEKGEYPVQIDSVEFEFERNNKL